MFEEFPTKNDCSLLDELFCHLDYNVHLNLKPGCAF